VSIHATIRPNDLFEAMRSLVVLLELRQRLRRQQTVLDMAIAVRLRQGRSCVELEQVRCATLDERSECDARLVVQLNILERELGSGGLDELVAAIDEAMAEPAAAALTDWDALVDRTAGCGTAPG